MAEVLEARYFCRLSVVILATLVYPVAEVLEAELSVVRLASSVTRWLRFSKPVVFISNQLSVISCQAGQRINSLN